MTQLCIPQDTAVKARSWTCLA